LEQEEPQVEQAVYVGEMQPALRKYLGRLREESYIDIRPGYVDVGASPNETKPIYAAYTPPQPKKKKKKQAKGRYEGRDRYARYQGKHAAAPAAGAMVASAAAATTIKTSSSSSVALTPASGKVVKTKGHAKKKKIKKEKVRFGRAPLTRVSEEQVATTTAPGTNVAPAAGNGPSEALLGTEAQPLGPDLTHAPVVEVKKGKTRLSDQARQKHEAAKHLPKNLKKKKKTKLATKLVNAPSANETATQQVQSAPLGLAGDTSKKPKKAKKYTARPGEKVRLSDQKKQKKPKGTQPEQAPATEAPATAQPAGTSSSTAQQPQP
jgi:peptidyl-prolyl cis-trans isomerase SurA